MSKRDEAAPKTRGGWKQWTEKEAREALAAWKKSGLPLVEFAREQGIGAERLRRWSKRLDEPSAGSTKLRTAVELVPAAVKVPLVDLGLGADVSIRFPLTGPVVDILNVEAVSSEWVGNLLAVVTASKSSR